jgi:hypothetical protein
LLAALHAALDVAADAVADFVSAPVDQLTWALGS